MSKRGARLDTEPSNFGNDLLSGCIDTWQSAIATGTLSSAELTAEALKNAENPVGEGARTFCTVYAEAAIAEARAIDARIKRRFPVGALGGVPISVKDLFDVAGSTTTSGSIARRSAPAATTDAVAVQRLKSAGAVIVGRTNMTEFAYSGLGINPHFGTPANPYDRERGRIPGGSSSGAAISVTDGMAIAAIGSDTGGSVRIPAALCGLVGFKPTQARMPMQGVFPLSDTLDSIGPVARSVEGCARLDAVLAGETYADLEPMPIAGLRLGMFDRYVMDDLEEPVSTAFDRAVSRLNSAGAVCQDLKNNVFEWIPSINRHGGFAAVESYATLGPLLRTSFELFDPFVASRILRGKGVTAGEYMQMRRDRAAFQSAVEKLDDDVDVYICPTTPCTAPRMDALEDIEAHGRINALLLRNPSIANLLDRPAISVPCQIPGDLPIGLMIIGKRGRDRALLQMAKSVETLFSGMSR